MLKKIASILMILAVFVLIYSPTPTLAKEKAIKLVFASWEPPNSPSAIVLEQFAKDLEVEFPGRLKISLQFGGTLGRPPEYYDVALNGTADISFFSTAYTPGRFPVTDLLLLPVKLPSSKVSTSAAIYLYEKGYMDKEYAATKLLWLAITPPYQIHSAAKKPLTSLDDLKGLKIRAAGQMGKAVEVMGGIPVAMPMTDVYTSLQRGVIDAAMNSYDAAAIFKLNEVTNSVTEYNLSGMSMAVTMNKDSYEKLPADIQGFIDRTKNKYSMALSSYMDSRDTERKLGREIYQLKADDIEKLPPLFSPLWEDYLNEFDRKGFPVKAASDDLASFLTSNFGIENPLVR